MIVGSCKGTLTALDENTGEVIWQYDITKDGEQNNFHGDGLVTEGMFLIGTDGVGGGNLYAFDLYTGEAMWNYPHARGVVTDVVRRGDTVIAATLDQEVICLDLYTGAPVWTTPAEPASDERSFNRSPAVTETRVFRGALAGRVDAFELETGEPAWSTPLGSRVTTSMVADADFVYVGTDDNRLWRVDQETGTADTLAALTKEPLQTMVLAGERLYLFLDWTLEGSEIVAIDTGSGRVIWRAAPPEGDRWTCARPYLVDGNVVVGSGDGAVRAYRTQDGGLSWRLTVDGTVRGMGFSDSAAFIGTLGGILYRVDFRPSD